MRWRNWRRCRERVLMVGDRSHDVEGAAAHGIDTVVVGWGYGHEDFTGRGTRPTRPAHVADVDRPARGARCLTPLHVTFVCSGNICRSPMAEKMFAHQIRERGLGRPGPGHQRGHRELACRRGRRRAGQSTCCAPHGYPSRSPSPPSSTTTTWRPTWWSRSAATTCGYCGIWVSTPTRVRMLRSFDPRSGAHTPDVEDPYYGTHDDFEDVFTVIDAALPGLHAWIDEQLDGVDEATGRSCCGRAGSPWRWWWRRSPICVSPCWHRGSSARTPRPRGRTTRSTRR